MKKTILGILVISLTAVLAAGIASAIPGERKGRPEFVGHLPESKLTKIVFIRYASGFQKEKPCDNDGVCDPGEKGWCSDCKDGGEEPPQDLCCGFLSGAKPRWNTIENYYYDNNNLGSVSDWATGRWDEATSATIFGEGLSGAGIWGNYDGRNSVVYDDYPQNGVLGVTAIWFRGKTIYEYDIMLDLDYFPNGKEADYDLETVVLHEFGHAAGLGDLYNTDCSQEVMYGHLAPNETRTTLGPGDTAGIQILYGI